MSTVSPNPNYDGYVQYYQVGTGGVPEWYRDTTRPYLGITGNLVLGGGFAIRSFLDFDNSLLPVGYTITNVVLWLYTAASSVTTINNNFNIDGLSFTAQGEGDNETLYNALATSTSYATGLNWEAFGWHSVDLGANAVTNFQSQGFLTLGLAMVNEDAGDGTTGGHWVKFYSMDNVQVPPESYYPYLVVTYTLGGSNTYTGVLSQTGVLSVTW